MSVYTRAPDLLVQMLVMILVLLKRGFLGGGQPVLLLLGPRSAWACLCCAGGCMHPWVEGLPCIWECRKVDLSFVPIVHTACCMGGVPAVGTGLGDTQCSSSDGWWQLGRGCGAGGPQPVAVLIKQTFPAVLHMWGDADCLPTAQLAHLFSLCS